MIDSYGLRNEFAEGWLFVNAVAWKTSISGEEGGRLMRRYGHDLPKGWHLYSLQSMVDNHISFLLIQDEPKPYQGGAW